MTSLPTRSPLHATALAGDLLRATNPPPPSSVSSPARLVVAGVHPPRAVVTG